MTPCIAVYDGSFAVTTKQYGGVVRKRAESASGIEKLCNTVLA